MQILYFAWVREQVGTAAEDLDLDPPGAATVGALIDLLRARSPRHAQALADRGRLRIAVNQDFATDETPVRPGDEIAIFPPVTGG
ncbi:molybdopterin converting factor subunit 1 [Zavarzinia compransoris]|uniref:Molybdopterin synthase sulfur carrier subunit n=1 Tax=Zavarzinia compransoris TaxID=1264899 RepID=A0A317DYN8_9PROT|nr:molybdopterin converting factor subunit 1 [Zavarzinia compransoris]PWR19868.1 molybdopterin converting factor subunit 1 [Zavarzinia compransoris]TDP45021.1 molybdopterin synthase subunit MoaD [Zavarzinia compransoris]